VLEHGPTTCSSKSLGTISGQRGFTPAAVAIARGRHRGARPGGIRSFANVWRTNSTQSGKRPGRGARPRLEGDNRLHPLREHGARHLSCPCPPGGVRRWATSCHTGGYWHGAPRQVQNTANGPFVAAGACFYWLHTHTPDGVIHIESPEPTPFTLGQFFDIWQQPLTAGQVGLAQGTITAYVNGQQYNGALREIPLAAHALIQLDTGQDVSAQPFTFPAGL